MKTNINAGAPAAGVVRGMVAAFIPASNADADRTYTGPGAAKVTIA